MSVVAGQTVVIKDVTVINPRQGSVQSHQNVIIEGGRIHSIAATSSPGPTGASVVDGKQKFLIPGLWDAHVHLTKTGVLSLPLFHRFRGCEAGGTYYLTHQSIAVR